MTYLSQRDPRWANIPVGTGSLTIGQIGCALTVLAMLLGTTPDVVNERLKAVGGFANGNEIVWDKIAEAFPGITCRRVWSYNNDDVLANLPCLVQVDGAPIGGTIHFVAYIGNHQLADPWDGQVKPTSTYVAQSYAVLTGTWNQTQADHYFVDDTGKYKIDYNNLDSLKVCFDAWVRLEKGDLVDKTQFETQLQATNSCQSQLKTATEQNALLQQQVTQLQNKANELQSKYDEDERTIIDLKGQMEANNKEDKDYAQKAYDAEHLAEDRGNRLHAIADQAGVSYDANKEDDVTEQILDEMHKMKQLQPIPVSDTVSIENTPTSTTVNLPKKSFLVQLVSLFYRSA